MGSVLELRSHCPVCGNVAWIEHVYYHKDGESLEQIWFRCCGRKYDVPSDCVLVIMESDE